MVEAIPRTIINSVEMATTLRMTPVQKHLPYNISYNI